MRRRFSLALCICGLPLQAWQQVPLPITLWAERIRVDIIEGRYEKADESIKKAVLNARLTERSEDAAGIRACAVRLAIERGRLQEAVRKLAEARYFDGTVGNDGRGVSVGREEAALLLALGDASAARTAAARSVATARRINASKLLLGYTQSLEALAALELNEAEVAERLLKEALSAIPAGKTKLLFHAPRILFAACRVATARGKYPTAEDYCLRGIELTQSTGFKTRDMPLGYGAVAELYLANGHMAQSRQAAELSLKFTQELFGDDHQDAARARRVLAALENPKARTPTASHPPP